MGNPVLVNEEDIPMVHQDKDYDEYMTPDTSRVNEKSFIEPDATEATSAIRLRQKVKRDKLMALHRHLNVAADPGLDDIDRFIIKKKKKQATLTCFFLMAITNGNLSVINVLVNFYRQRH